MAVQAQFPLCGSQDWMIDNGCGGGGGFIVNNNSSSFNYYSHLQQQKLLQQQQQQIQLHQQQQQQLLQNHQQKNQNLCFESTGLVVPSSFKNTSNNHHPPSMSFSQSMAAYDEKQRQEIDHYIRLQNERLRLLLQEQRKQQVASLVKKIESKALPLLKQKDEEIAQASKRTAELEDFLKRLEMESQAWQRVAQENEAMVISLNNTIEQLREKASCCFDNGAEDAESCCEVNRGEEEEETGQKNRVFLDYDNNVTEEETARKMMMVCKGCNSRNSCILFLPCRHLCSCKACEAFFDSCPVCHTPKKARIEALII